MDHEEKVLVWASQISFLSYDQHVYIHVPYTLENKNFKKNCSVIWKGWPHDKFYMTCKSLKISKKGNYVTLKHRLNAFPHKNGKA